MNTIVDDISDAIRFQMEFLFHAEAVREGGIAIIYAFLATYATPPPNSRKGKTSSGKVLFPKTLTPVIPVINNNGIPPWKAAT
ncbi:MAG TPA: hypothetical protein VIT91_14010 [Chthoniobacterales bacterium]